MGGLIMKQFNLEEYLKDPSKKIVTRNGKPAKIVCTNFISKRPIIAEIDDQGVYSLSYDSSSMHTDFQSPHALFFDTEKHERWINIYWDSDSEDEDDIFTGGYVYKSKEEAEEVGIDNDNYVTTVKIEWEE